MERDGGLCQFFHKEPTRGRPERVYFMLPYNRLEYDEESMIGPNDFITICDECKKRLTSADEYLEIVRWEPDSGLLKVRGPNGRLVCDNDLWFYVKRTHRPAPLVIDEDPRQTWNARVRRSGQGAEDYLRSSIGAWCVPSSCWML